MKLEQSWRWFGPEDPVSLSAIKQAGANSVVTALHHIPNGEVWPVKEILKRKYQVEKSGLNWHVVESLPVHEEIKQRTGNFRKKIQNYIQSLRNLSRCGIRVVCYNFMPLLDWTRTDLDYAWPDGSKSLQFDIVKLTVFDLYILKRKSAEDDYSDEIRQEAYKLNKRMSSKQKAHLIKNILAGLPGSEEKYDLQKFKKKIADYSHITSSAYREHLAAFLSEVGKAADEVHIELAIHPDDPAFSILGLPRVVSLQQDVEYLLSAYSGHANGVCFCTGSFGTRTENKVEEMLKNLANRTYFAHLRNIIKDNSGNFVESNHLDGLVNMASIVETLVKENEKRTHPIPYRPDHGLQMLDDLKKKINPGYSAIGRLRGLAELRGLEAGIRHTLYQY